MIALIHPSRGRPEQANATMIRWKDKANNPENIVHYLGLDKDDPFLERYLKLFLPEDSVINLHPHKNVVEATNRTAALSKEDVLVYLSDDFDCFESWDEIILERVSQATENKDHKDRWMLVVYDGIQKRDCLTIPIMSRGLYLELGYFFYPGYLSMFVDNDLYYATRDYHIKAYDLVFKHHHMEKGRDHTYARNNNKTHWNHGHELFNQRSRENGWGKIYNCRMK